MTRLILVRHGESNTTVARIIGGYRTCTGLSPLGVRQADRLRRRLTETSEIAADALIASNFRRALQTAEIIAPALGGLSVVEDAGFGEHDPGPTCDGMSMKAYVDEYGADWWEENDPFGVTFPGGETIAAFQYRVGTAVRRTLDVYTDQTVVVACHGGVVDAVLRFALKSPATGAFEVHTVNTSITELLLIKRNMWRLLRYNDAAHLAGLPAATQAVSE